MVFELVIGAFANPGRTLRENQNLGPPESLAGSVWLGAGLTLTTLVLLGVFVARMGGTARAAALVAVPVLPVATLAAVWLEGSLFPHFYWYFMVPGGWVTYYVWVLLLYAFPVEVPVAALIAAGSASVFRRLRGNEPRQAEK